jgi:uncharacterized protein (DUF2141 family)
MTARLVLLTVLAIVLATIFSPFATAEDPPTTQPLATLKVTIKDLRNTKGQLVFGVFKQADGFPSKADKSVNWQIREAKDDDRTFVCQLPPGKYAATVLHDENANGKMDTGALGIPKEGYGVTNNPKPKARQAKFEEGLFDLPADGAELMISLQYFL